MQQPSPNAYLRTQVMTAGPMQLRMLLYDGALKFTRHARTALEDENFERSYDNLSRAKSIVLELSNSLNNLQASDLCDRLKALYSYMYRRLVEANMNRELAIVDEVIELLEYERETWRQLMAQAGEQQEHATSSTDTPPSPPAAPAAYSTTTSDPRAGSLSKSA